LHDSYSCRVVLLSADNLFASAQDFPAISADSIGTMQGNLARDSQSAKLASVNSVKIQSNQLALFNNKKFSVLQQASAFFEQLSYG
jgi:hypothetical protein